LLGRKTIVLFSSIKREEGSKTPTRADDVKGHGIMYYNALDAAPKSLNSKFELRNK